MHKPLEQVAKRATRRPARYVDPEAAELSVEVRKLIAKDLAALPPHGHGQCCSEKDEKHRGHGRRGIDLRARRRRAMLGVVTFLLLGGVRPFLVTRPCVPPKGAPRPGRRERWFGRDPRPRAILLLVLLRLDIRPVRILTKLIEYVGQIDAPFPMSLMQPVDCVRAQGVLSRIALR